MTENIIRIHRPELTAEERAKRMKQIKKAAANLLAAVERSAAQKRKEQPYEHNHH